ncbi:hypothetical protein, partial [Escherichia coli]|uniref:hypothetical protein n=3 Tax=Escherichia coli TaxID=562 RepID=UPI001D062AAE
MFWNPEVITTTGKSLRITQIQFNIIYIMRTDVVVGELNRSCETKWTHTRQNSDFFHLQQDHHIRAALL